MVYAASGVGKVSAASVATSMVTTFGAVAVIFSGVAGGIVEGQQV